MKTLVVIPSRSRIYVKTLKLLENSNYEKLLVVPRSEVFLYEVENPNINVVGCDEDGIGLTRHWILDKYFPLYDFIVMIDDDIEELVRVKNCSDIDQDFDELIDEMKVNLISKEAYFGGITLCPNRFFAKDKISENLKYISGALQIYRKKEYSYIPKTEYKHFEDYVYNILYFQRDTKILRWNNVIPKTNNYNPVGGICADYGSLEERLKDAEIKATEIVERFGEKIVKKVKKKKSSRCPECVNLRLNHWYKVETFDGSQISKKKQVKTKDKNLS